MAKYKQKCPDVGKNGHKTEKGSCEAKRLNKTMPRSEKILLRSCVEEICCRFVQGRCAQVVWCGVLCSVVTELIVFIARGSSAVERLLISPLVAPETPDNSQILLGNIRFMCDATCQWLSRYQQMYRRMTLCLWNFLVQELVRMHNILLASSACRAVPSFTEGA